MGFSGTQILISYIQGVSRFLYYNQVCVVAYYQQDNAENKIVLAHRKDSKLSCQRLIFHKNNCKLAQIFPFSCQHTTQKLTLTVRETQSERLRRKLTCQTEIWQKCPVQTDLKSLYSCKIFKLKTRKNTGIYIFLQDVAKNSI